MSIIAVDNIRKVYKTNKNLNLFKRQYTLTTAVNDVSFTVDEGEILGLIGLNGAGKTSIIKLVSGIMKCDAGKIAIMGEDPFRRSLHYRKITSLVMGQNGQLDNDLTILDSISFFSAIYGIRKEEAILRARRMANELMLSQEDLQKQVRSLSLGQRMKGELILAFNHLPRIIFLDEPTLGLDFMAQNAIRNFLISYVKDVRASMILTSHYAKDIEELCRNIFVLYKGKKIYYGSLYDLKVGFGLIENDLDKVIENLYREQDR